MIECVGYLPEHLANISPRDCHIGEIPKAIPPGAITILHNKKPVAIFGLVLWAEGIWHWWGLLSDGVKECPIAFHKECLRILKENMLRHNARRMQMDVRADYKMGRHWATALGFQCEGLMKKFGPNGEDHYLYARTE